jgi:hypothetical protein
LSGARNIAAGFCALRSRASITFPRLNARSEGRLDEVAVLLAGVILISSII